jgi:hypothetical protein
MTQNCSSPIHFEINNSQKISKSYANTPSQLVKNGKYGSLYDQIYEKENERTIHKQVLEVENFYSPDNFLNTFSGDPF